MVGFINMVSGCLLAMALEVRLNSRSPVLGFCFDATFHRTLHLQEAFVSER